MGICLACGIQSSIPFSYIGSYENFSHIVILLYFFVIRPKFGLEKIIPSRTKVDFLSQFITNIFITSPNQTIINITLVLIGVGNTQLILFTSMRFHVLVIASRLVFVSSCHTLITHLLMSKSVLYSGFSGFA